MVSYLFAGPVKESKKATDCEVLLDIVLCKVRIRSINPKICSLQQQQQQQKLLAELKLAMQHFISVNHFVKVIRSQKQ